MHPVWILFRKEWLQFVRDRPALVLSFAVPLALIYIFGNVLGGSGGGPASIRVAVVNESADPVVAQVVEALAAEELFRVVLDEAGPVGGPPVPLTSARTTEFVRSGEKVVAGTPLGGKADLGGPVRFALVFPPDTMAEGQVGLRLRFLYNPRNDIETQMVEGLLQKTIFSKFPGLMMASLRDQWREGTDPSEAQRFEEELADLIGRNFGVETDEILAQLRNPLTMQFGPGSTDGAGGASPDELFSNLLRVEREQLSGQQVKNPGPTRQAGGWALMFVLFSVSSAALSLLQEKRMGIYQRLLSGPVQRGHILFSKYFFGVSLGTLQVMVLFLFAHWMFGVDIWPNFLNLVIFTLVVSLAAVSFGMLLASISGSEAVANALSTFLVLSMSAVGGAWFPTTWMPSYVQFFSQFTLVYWGVEGFMGVLWDGKSLAELAQPIGVLLGMSALINAVALWRFRTGDLFR